MSMQNWRKRTEGGGTEVLREKTVAMSLCLPRITCMSSERRGLAGEEPATDRLNLSTACPIGS